jgi:hypothetical protein
MTEFTSSSPGLDATRRTVLPGIPIVPLRSDSQEIP